MDDIALLKSCGPDSDLEILVRLLKIKQHWFQSLPQHHMSRN